MNTKAVEAPAEERHHWVAVSGWQRHRQVVLRDNTVEMMIALINCSHCATCSGRMDRVRAAVAGKEARWRREEGGYWIVLPYPAEAARDGEAIVTFLREALGLPLHLAD